MNRFMVTIGIGSLTLFVASTAICIPSRAESPETSHLVSSATAMETSGTPLVTWHQSMSSGWAESKRRKVPMVIFITRGHCRFCDAMKIDTWCDQSISRQLADNFVAIRLTPNQNAAELKRIKVDTYPTTLIGMPEGKIVDHKFGYQPVREIATLLTKAKIRILQR